MTSHPLATFTLAWARVTKDRVRRDQRGAVTETVILVAIFAALALAIGAIIVVKVTDKANSIPTS